MEAKLELYRIFQVVAEHESISAAARTLFLSQPAVSQAVKQLEEQVRVKLFLRGKRGVELTEEGRLLYEYVRNALGVLESGEERLRQARLLEAGQLTIGASDTLTRWWLLPYLKAFRQNYPGVRLSLRNGTSRQVLELLHEGKVDVAFASRPEEEEHFRVEKCFDTRMVFVKADDGTWDTEKVYTAEEISRMPLILLDRKASSRLFLEKIFAGMGLPLRAEFELATHELVLSAARIGLGTACVTREFAFSALEEGAVREIRTDLRIPARQVTMCTLERVSVSPAAQHFMESIRRGGVENVQL